MSSVTYGKCIVASVILTKVLWQLKLSRSFYAMPMMRKQLKFFFKHLGGKKSSVNFLLENLNLKLS